MNKNRIAALLANGLKQIEVATIVGVTPAAICLLVNQDDEFKLLLADYTAKADKEDAEEVAIDAKYVSAEHALVKSIIASADGADMREATMALRVIADRNLQIRRGLSSSKGVSVTEGGQAGQVNVIVNLPSHTVQALQVPAVHINGEQEVIAIGNNSIAPMPSKSVVNLFKKLKGEGHGSDPIEENRSSEKAIPATEASLIFANQSVLANA